MQSTLILVETLIKISIKY